MQGDLPTSSLQRQTVITQLPTKNVNLCCIGIFQKDFQIGVVPYESTDQMKNWQTDLHPNQAQIPCCR